MTRHKRVPRTSGPGADDPSCADVLTGVRLQVIHRLQPPHQKNRKSNEAAQTPAISHEDV